MAADSQISLTVTIVFIALFSVAIVGFAIGFASDNDAAMSIESNFSSLNTNIRDNMSTFKSDSEGTYSSILETTVEPGSDVAQSTGPFAITPGNLIGVAINIFYLPYKFIFGSGAGFGIFFTVFAAFIVLIFGLLLYKTLKGNP